MKGETFAVGDTVEILQPEEIYREVYGREPVKDLRKYPKNIGYFVTSMYRYSGEIHTVETVLDGNDMGPRYWLDDVVHNGEKNWCYFQDYMMRKVNPIEPVQPEEWLSLMKGAAL